MSPWRLSLGSIKKNTMKTEWINLLREHAERNYERGYGWQVYVECYSQADWERLIDGCQTYRQARRRTVRIAKALTEQYLGAQP